MWEDVGFAKVFSPILKTLPFHQTYIFTAKVVYYTVYWMISTIALDEQVVTVQLE